VIFSTDNRFAHRSGTCRTFFKFIRLFCSSILVMMETKPLIIISVNALVARLKTPDSLSFISTKSFIYLRERTEKRRKIQILIQTKNTQSANNVSLFNVSLFISREKAFRRCIQINDVWIAGVLRIWALSLSDNLLPSSSTIMFLFPQKNRNNLILQLFFSLLLTIRFVSYLLASVTSKFKIF